MMLNMYCFFDSISNQHLPNIFFIQNDNVAQRQFSNFINAKNFPFADIINDLQIFCVGIFNIENGVITPQHKFLAYAKDFLKNNKEA